MHIFKEWPKVEEACEPDNIKWENLGYSKKNRRLRMCINWLISIGLILLSLIGIVYMKDLAKDYKEKYDSEDIICP